MTVLFIILAGGGLLFLGGRFYAPLIARVLGERSDRPTPASLINDGRDYVPTKTPVVFAHHYASIAGGGPIIGPVLAIYYGWGPALLWLVLGAIFLGAVHDYVATYLAMREGGKNLTVIARRYIGQGAFVMMLILLVALLALVCAAFLDLSAKALVSKVAFSDLHLSADQSWFPVEMAKHAFTGQIEPHAVIGGIAFTSVIVITICAPLVGYLYLKRKTPVWICSMLAVVICAGSVVIGILWPISVSPLGWKVGVSIYVLLSAGVPVWLFLQSRDFINVHILYMGIVFLVVSVIAAAIRGGGAMGDAGHIPFSNWGQASAKLGPGWPAMFVIISCGAVSGFHSLCAGGTTCKQLSNELAARRIGYYAMLLESLLAVCVVSALIVGLSMSGYKGYCYPSEAKGNAVLTFAMAVGNTSHVGLGLPVAVGAVGAMLLLEGFLVTTLDTAIRLTRYMIEEGWATFFGRYDVFAGKTGGATTSAARGPQTEFATALEVAGSGGLAIEEPPHLGEPQELHVIATSGIKRKGLRFLQYYWVNSGLAVGLMLVLALTNGYNAVWKMFGSSNQLLAALALLVGTTWLLHRGRAIWYTLAPAIFMLATSLTMMVWLLVDSYLPGCWSGDTSKIPLAIADGLVLTMTAGILALTVRRWFVGSRTIAKEPTMAD